MFFFCLSKDKIKSIHLENKVKVKYEILFGPDFFLCLSSNLEENSYGGESEENIETRHTASMKHET